MDSPDVSAAMVGIVRPIVKVAAVSAAEMRFFMLVMRIPPVFHILGYFCKQYNTGMESVSRAIFENKM
jgi:hypothetical protein